MKMKYTNLVILISLFTIMLAGCSNTATTTVSANNGLSSATRLELGTLKLDSTDQAITSAQATELVILWQGY